MNSVDGRQDDDPALSSFVLLARFLGVSADAAQLKHDRGRGLDPFSFDDLMRAARHLGLIARTKSVTAHELVKIPTPALIQLQGDDVAILLKADEQAGNCRYLVQRSSAPRPEIWQQSEMAERFGGFALLMTSREQVAGEKRKFDVSWFIPALVKYRRHVFRQVKTKISIALRSFRRNLTNVTTPHFR